MVNKIIFDIFANIFDYYPTQSFIDNFIANQKDLNVAAICDHNFLKLSIAYSFVWKTIYNTYPTKKDFMDYIKLYNYSWTSNINIDKTVLEQILNSFMHIRLGITKNINLDLIFKKFEGFVSNLRSHQFINSFIRSKLRYRFLSRLDAYDDIEDVNINLISTVIKLMKNQKKCTVYKNYNAISDSTFDDYDNPIIFSELDEQYLSDYEKVQYILYKDYHFSLKLINNVSVYVVDKSVSDDTVKTIVSAYENSTNNHIVLLNYKCSWHDDLFTFPDVPLELYNMLPSLCEYHITIDNSLYPACKSLSVNREKAMYYLRTPLDKSRIQSIEYSYHSYYDKYIINSLELIPENESKYPLEHYIIYDCYNKLTNLNDLKYDSNTTYSTRILVKDKDLYDKMYEKVKDITGSENIDINSDETQYNDFIIIGKNEDISQYLKYMMNGSILVKIGKNGYIKHMINGVLVPKIDEAISIINKLILSDDGKLQKEFLKRGSIKMGYLLESELVESLWNIHIKNTCPVRNNNPRNGILIYLNFAMIYAIKHMDKIIDLNKKMQLKESESSNVVVLIDNRPNYLSLLSILLSLCNLNATWKCRLYTSKKGISYYEKWLGDIVEVVHSPILDVKKFHIDVYNKLLMDEDFWGSLSKYEKCLTIQDDGVLLRKGIERFMKYDYVGAPWIDVPDNQYLKDHVNSDLVGNGGLSFRTISLMKKIVTDYKKEKKGLFYKNLNNIPEDVYFVKFLKKLNANMPKMQEALLFSSEEIIGNDSIGFHKIWCYHKPEDTKLFFKNILSTLEKPI